MRTCKLLSTAIALTLVAGSVACSSGSKSSTTTTPPAISVTLGTVPSSLAVNQTASLTATVANDSANKGVTWSCTPTPSCGSFSPTSTASGSATTYTAPATGNGSVTVIATSVSDTTKNKSASISITVTTVSLGAGNYVYSLGGSDAKGASYNVVGAITVSSTGTITAGEQDFVDSANSDLHDEINPTGSTITTTNDGHLQLTLVSCSGQTCTSPDTNVGVGGTETIVGSVITTSTCGTAGGPCEARLSEFDSFATSSGLLEVQNATAAATTPSGGYAFAIGGVPSREVVIGGILNFSSGALSTSNSVFDINQAGTASLGQTFTAGTVAAPDSNGRTQISLTPTNTSLFPVLNLAAYVVDSNHLQVAAASFPVGGTAYSQNSANLGVPSSPYVIGVSGQDVNGEINAAGELTLTSTTVTGTLSYNDRSTLQSAAKTVNGVCVVDTTNLGRFTLNTVTNGTATFNFELYIDGNGHAMAISTDATDVVEGPGYQQTAGGAFTSGSTYVLSATGADKSDHELDANGAVTIGSGTFSGFADLNYLSTGTAATQSSTLGVSGAFIAPSSGFSTGTGNTITGLDVTTSTNGDAFDYYFVDSTKVIAVEVDANQTTLATFDITH